MLDDTPTQNRKQVNKPAVGNGNVALYGRIDRFFCLTFRANVTVNSLIHTIADCHEFLQDTPMWGPDWIAVGYNQKAAELAVSQSEESPETARQLVLDDIFAAIWSGLFTGAINGQELVTSALPPHAVPEIDLGVLMHRQAQW